jgi:hypothetical protein
LDGYDVEKKTFLLKGFTEGFRIGFQGKVNSCVPDNLKSSQEFPGVVQDHILKEIEAKRVLGPFENVPFTQFQCSPIGLVEKKTKGEYRMIHHLSHPKGKSVNDQIHDEWKSVSYAGIEDAIHLVRETCPKAYMCKTDVKKAFRILPLHPDDRCLFVFAWNGKFYVDLALQMGCSSSCMIFEAFSTAVEWIARQKLNIRVVHILDDFFISSISKEIGKTELHRFLEMCEDIGIPMAPEKTMGPDTSMVFVGFEIDTIKEEVRLPVDKLVKCSQEIKEIVQKTKATLREIQSIVGLLNFACAVILPGRPFLRRLIDLTIGITAPHHRIRITKKVRDDLEMWLAFLTSHNGRCLFVDQHQLSVHDIALYTDASGKIGYGAIFGKDWFQGLWKGWWTEQNITLLELYPIVIAVKVWGHKIQNKRLCIFTDNAALVSVLQRQTSKEPLVMCLVRDLVLMCLRNNLVLTAKHVPGEHNAIADALSRFQMERFRILCPRAEQLPVEIPALPDRLDP